MAKIIDDETIENVCILAKLSLSDEAKEKAKQDMQKMLDYVEKLDELDTDGVEPLSDLFGQLKGCHCLQFHNLFSSIQWSSVPDTVLLFPLVRS